jgi:drug/metabolite transporter (DMT)-like permease
MGMIKKNNASIFLFINALLWGSSYVWSKMLLGFLPQFSILSICSFGCLISTFIMFYPYIKTINSKELLPILKISILSIVSNSLCMLALQFTSSSNTAFIVQLSVIITPLLMSFSEKKIPQGKLIASMIIALAGLFLLTCDLNTFRLKPGDLIALGNALFFSIYLVSLNRNANKVNPVHYTFIQHTANTIVFMILAGFLEFRTINFQHLKSPVFAMLISASIFISLVTILIQSLAIKYVRPEKATFIYTFEPITAMFLGFIFMGEKLNGIIPVIGCLLIIVSVVCTLYTPKPRIKSKPIHIKLKDRRSAVLR